MYIHMYIPLANITDVVKIKIYLQNIQIRKSFLCMRKEPINNYDKI